MAIVPHSYTHVAQEVATVADNLGMPIDAGIRQAVIALRMWRFPTDGSCEGHTDDGLPYPWVEIYAPDQPEEKWIQANKSEKTRLDELLEEYYAARKVSYRFEFDSIGIFGAFRLVPQGYRDTTTYSRIKALAARDQFDAFADFLIQKATS
jgi:hypothetical protein